jgi:glycosyltransferase involved in cell wall biosynthesis
MVLGKKIAVVMPAYNAERTLEQTFNEMPHEVVDEVILVDDFSRDRTVECARSLGIKVFLHDSNYGYGRNQKTCYTEALKSQADIVIMLHPDYQYTPRLILPMAAMIAGGEYDLVLASRIIGGGALKGGMPCYKYIANRFLTAMQNILLGSKLSEFHTGYRAFSRRVLETLPIMENSDDFVFDNQMLAQALFFGFRIGELSCPTKYFPEASSINVRRSIRYGFGVILVSLGYRLQKMGWFQFRFLSQKGKGLTVDYYQKDYEGKRNSRQ